MAVSKYPGPAEALERYEALVTAHPEAQRKGAKNPYTSRNGHMFSFLDPSGSLALRLSDELIEQFGASFSTHPVIQHNSVMRGYVEIPDELFEDLDALGQWFADSWDWIGSLDPKPTKKS